MEDEQCEDDREHLLEVLEEVLLDLSIFWQVAEPLLRREVFGPQGRALSRTFLRGCDGVRHSVAWLQAMPPRASDGTHVWELLPEAAVTNEPEARNDQMAGRETDPDRVSGGREERDSVPDRAGPGVEDLKRQLRITQWKADQAQRKAAATPRRFPPRRKGKR